jgi:hypothetical protein
VQYVSIDSVPFVLDAPRTLDDVITLFDTIAAGSRACRRRKR